MVNYKGTEMYYINKSGVRMYTVHHNGTLLLLNPYDIATSQDSHRNYQMGTFDPSTKWTSIKLLTNTSDNKLMFFFRIPAETVITNAEMRFRNFGNDNYHVSNIRYNDTNIAYEVNTNQYIHFENQYLTGADSIGFGIGYIDNQSTQFGQVYIAINGVPAIIVSP